MPLFPGCHESLMPAMKRHSNLLRSGVNYVGAQVGWLACAIGAARGMPWLGPLVVGIYLSIHLRWSPIRGREVRLIGIVGLLGLVVDSVMKGAGLITYHSPWSLAEWLAPWWIVAMWLLFATSLNTSLSWLEGRYWLAALLGALFGPLSYLAGERLGAISFNYTIPTTVVFLALMWGSIIPFLVWLAHFRGETPLLSTRFPNTSRY